MHALLWFHTFLLALFSYYSYSFGYYIHSLIYMLIWVENISHFLLECILVSSKIDFNLWEFFFSFFLIFVLMKKFIFICVVGFLNISSLSTKWEDVFFSHSNHVTLTCNLSINYNEIYDANFPFF